MVCCELLSARECQALASSYLGAQSSPEVVEVQVCPLAGPRGGYTSEHLVVKLTVRDGTSEPQVLQFFAKGVPRNAFIHKEYLQSARFYAKETTFYDDLVKKMRAAVCEGSSDCWVPQIYFFRENLMVLEDLSLRNYNAFGKRNVMNLQMCEVVLAELARFHAASVVLEEKYSAAGEKRSLKDLYPTTLEDNIKATLESDECVGWFPAGLRSFQKLVDFFPNYKDDPVLLRKIKVKLTHVYEMMNTLHESTGHFRNVVCHTDLWAGNLMVRFDNGGKLIAVRFVDFQLVRYCPPACDVLNFLFMMTRKNFRCKYKERVLAHYYATFEYELRRHDLDPQSVLSEAVFRESCDLYNDRELGRAALSLQMVLLDLDFAKSYFENPDRFVQFLLVDRSSEIVHSFQNDKEYRLRIAEISEEFIEKCVL